MSVYIPLKEYECSQLTKESVEVTFGENNFDVKVNLPDGNCARLQMRKLFDAIVPEECKYRVDAKYAHWNPLSCVHTVPHVRNSEKRKARMLFQSRFRVKNPLSERKGPFYIWELQRIY